MGKEIKMNGKQQNVNINPADCEDVLCEKCENQTFQPAFMFKKISAVLSPTGAEALIPVQVYSCIECSHINAGFLPKERPNA